MTKIVVDADNPNILSPEDIVELGIEEATDDLGPSWEEVAAALAAKGNTNGKDENQ